MRRAFVSAFARAMSRVRPGPHANGFEDSFLSRECGDACAEVDRHLGRDTHLLWAAAAAAAARPSRSTWPLVYLTSRAGFRALVMRARTSGATPPALARLRLWVGDRYLRTGMPNKKENAIFSPHHRHVFVIQSGPKILKKNNFGFRVRR